MRLVNLKRVARPLIIVLLIALVLGNGAFVFAAEPVRSAPKTYYYLTDHLGGIDKVGIMDNLGCF